MTNHRRRANQALLLSSLAAAIVLSQGCDTTPTPVGGSLADNGLPSETGAGIAGTSSGTASVNTSAQAFSSSAMVKVVFSKNSFFTNNNPNPLGCGGDARVFYDPQTDRIVPVQPSWLRNVAVDLTNSNAIGASLAIGCSVTGNGSAPASNCASFDDRQPLVGANANSIAIGGFGCSLGVAGCIPNALTSDVWTLNSNDVSTLAGWTEQNMGLPPTTPPLNTNPGAPGYAFHGGDYDVIHNQYYLFGGVTPNTSDPTAPGVFSNSVVELNLESSGAVSTVYPPASITSPTSTLPPPNYSPRHFYAGWGKSAGFDSALNGLIPPPPMVGPSFSWGMRRDPTMKSTCMFGDSPASFAAQCQLPASFQSYNSSTTRGTATTLKAAVSTNDDNDYFLLMGGMQTNGLFNKNIYVYKPHPYSVDVSTAGVGAATAPTGGDWMLMSNVPAVANVISGTVMSIVDIGAGPSAASGVGSTPVQSLPYIATPVGARRQAGDIFAGWLGRGFHGTSYDPGMNRFYLFGGLENVNAALGAPLPATAIAPNLATNDVWIYDPPVLGRRPTSSCWTAQMPDGTPLASPISQLPTGRGLQPFGGGPSPAGSPAGANANLDANANYVRGPFVFPPGGCLQRYKLDNLLPSQLPPARFAHGQAFDPENKLVYVFGGCVAPGVIHGSGAPNAGDPIRTCPGPGLLNDLWVYVPPVVREIVPQSYASTAAAAATPGPFNPLTLLADPTNTDLWLDHIPYTLDNQATNAPLTAPPTWQAVGNWVHLLPGSVPNAPTPRAGAQVTFDQAHGRLYLQGGFGCIDATCAAPPQALNDTWVYTPPIWEQVCGSFREQGFCGTQAGLNQGAWTQLIPNTQASALTQPSQRYGGTAAFTYTTSAYGDDFYTVTNAACPGQGPIISSDATTSGGYVGAIYLDVDRTQMPATSNLVINLKMLPFDADTKLPAYNDGGVPNGDVNVFDNADSTDQAVLRVQFMHDPLNSVNAIQSSLQPRFHEFVTGSSTIGDTVFYAAGPNGTPTDKQIFVPLTIDSNINMIKIERVSGSVKFYEMTVSLF